MPLNSCKPHWTLHLTVAAAAATAARRRIAMFFFESGVYPIPCMYRAIQQGKAATTCQLLWQRGVVVDPFFCKQEENTSNNGHAAAADPSSPFHPAAARLTATTILEIFLGALWDGRFSYITGGNRKNGNENDPIHVLCRDKHLPLPAVKLVVERYDGALTTVRGW